MGWTHEDRGHVGSLECEMDDTRKFSGMVAQMKIAMGFTSRSLGLCLVVGGVTGIVVIGRLVASLLEVWPRGVAAGQETVLIANSLVLAAFLSTTVSAGLAGYWLIRARGRGRVLAMIVLAVQSIAVAVPGFQYSFCFLALAGLGISGGNGPIRAGLFYQAGTQMNLSMDSLHSWSLILNVPAVVFFVLLLIQWWRLRTVPRRTSESDGGDS